MLDLYALYSFLRKLTTPFDKWPAYKLGIIDDKGSILKPVRNTREEKDAFGPWDRTVLRLKKLLHRVPGGDSRLASYVAAYQLVKETYETNGELTEGELTLMLEDITNSVGAGGVAGIGATPDDMPPVRKKPLTIARKGPSFKDFIKEDVEKATSLIYQKRLKRHPMKTIPVTKPSTYGDDDDQ